MKMKNILFVQSFAVSGFESRFFAERNACNLARTALYWFSKKHAEGSSGMDGAKILGLILDIGAAMIQSGAETHRVEDSLYRLCDSYRFTDCNIWVVPSNIQATVTAPDGERHTQIRHVRNAGVHFHQLDRLNDLSRHTCTDTPDEAELSKRLKAVLDIPSEPAWLNYLAGAFAGAGFGVFFNCDFMDALVALCASLLVTFFVRWLGRRESNPMILNFISAFLAELFILLSVRFGFGHHTGYITIGVVMLLISGLGATNGVRDLVHLDTLSGVMNISVSFTGAVGIAMGIALPLLLLKDWGTPEMMILNPNVVLSLLSCIISGIGFALWFHVRGIQILYCALGAVLTWGIYLLVFHFYPSVFTATMLASATSALFAQVMARVNKAPATIFQTVSAIPLIPGATLYYMMYGFVTNDRSLALQKGSDLLLICFGIVIGFMVVEVLGKYIWRKPAHRHHV